MRRARNVELPLLPGALSDDTESVAKLKATDMDKVRARGNRWETLKGWTAFNASGMTAGKARGIHRWATLTGLPVVLAASESAVNAWINGSRLTVTPKWADVFLSNSSLVWSTGTNPTITCTWNVYNPVTATYEASPHFLQVGDVVTYQGINGFLGGSVTFDLNASFTITAVPSPTTFQFVATGTAAAPGGNTGGGGAYVCTVAYRAGLATGTGDAISARPRIYSVDNFGENAVFCGSDGTPVYYWQPATSYPELIDDEDFVEVGDTDGNWSNTAGILSHISTSDSVNAANVGYSFTGGKTYELIFTLSSFGTTAALSMNFLTNNGTGEVTITIYPEITTNTVGGADRTYSCRFVCPPSPIDFVITGTGTFSITSISIKLLSIAHPISEAPQKNYALAVSGNHILHLFGSVEADGDFNPLLHRWSAQDNYREWIPDTDNVSGENILSLGSYAVCGAQVGDSMLILSDTAAFVAGFTSNGYSLLPVGQGCGAVGPRVLAVHNNRAFWASDTGFHAFDGAQPLTIECPLKDRYVNRLAQYQENKTFAWINSEYGELWVHYAHTDDGTETSRYLVFNFTEQGNPWSFGTFNRTCFMRAGGGQHPIAIDTSGNIWSHETGTSLTGVTLPFIETGYATSGDGDRWYGCRRYYPDIKDQAGNIEFTITGKRTPQGQNTTQEIGPFILTPDQEKLDFLIASRQMKFKWTSADTTTQWRLGVVGLEIVAERERR